MERVRKSEFAFRNIIYSVVQKTDTSIRALSFCQVCHWRDEGEVVMGGGRGELQGLGPRLGWACTPAPTHCLTPGQTLASKPLAVVLRVRNGTRSCVLSCHAQGQLAGQGRRGHGENRGHPQGPGGSGCGDGRVARVRENPLSLCWSGQWCQKLKPLPSMLP